MQNLHPKRHSLKAWPESFQAVWDGTKPYEVRKNDRNYLVGDTLQIEEWLPPGRMLSFEQSQAVGEMHVAAPPEGLYTGRCVGATITYMSAGPEWGLPEGLCVLALHVWKRILFHDRSKPLETQRAA